MITDETEADVLDNAGAEEKTYNWVEAANLYEPVIKYYLDKGLIRKAAKTYKKLGYAYSRAAEIAETAEEYLERYKNCVNAYKDAANNYKQTGNRAEELECMADALYFNGFISDSHVEVRDFYSKAYELFVKSSEIYSKEDDQEGLARTLSRTAMVLSLRAFFSSDLNEIKRFMDKCGDTAVEAWELSMKLKNIQSIAESLLAGGLSLLDRAYMDDYKWNKDYRESGKNLILKCNESLKPAESCDDFRFLGIIYAMTGMYYGAFGVQYVEDEREQREYVDRGLELLEKGLEFARKAKDNQIILWSIFWLDWWAWLGGRFEYLQKRLFNDLNEYIKIGSRCGNLINIWRWYANIFPAIYYTNVAQRSFFTPDQKKTYAEQGIKFAKEAMKISAYSPMVVLSYQMLTWSYSQLTTLAKSEDERDKNAQKMLQYAKESQIISDKGFKGLAAAGAYSSLSKAYKTLANITKNKEKKIKMLSAAGKASKKYIEHAMESRTGIIIAKIRLGLLYEELAIFAQDNNSLRQAEQTFLEVIKDSFERGYISYAAAAHEYLARVEDRLGNHTASAENYVKAQIMHEKSLINIEYKKLKKRVKEKIEYNQAWNLIEHAKAHHKRENHIKAKECYGKASEILNKMSRYNYEAPYYAAWSLLEEAEQISKQDRQDDAIERYKATRIAFKKTVEILATASKETKEKLEGAKIEKLKKVAKLRMNYCSARINLENARILGRKGQHIEAAEKFVLAASQFRNVCTVFKIERERKEIEAIYYLCRAWECMELAEQYEAPERFSDAANLFLKASNLFTETKLKLLAEGNSSFCQALEFGIKFDESIDTQIKTQLYQKVKVMLRKAASIYDKGGYESGADWALATSTYFDATWNLIRADETLELEEREKYLGIGARYLNSAAELFNKAGYKDKEQEILKKINRLEKEEKILFSALNTIEQPSISRSTIGIVAPTCPIEISQSTRLSEIQQFSEESRRIKKKKLEDSPELYECDTSINIIHLSDIQEGRFGIKEDISMGDEGYYNYLSDLESKLEILHRKDKIDFVVISGDLASTGSKEEYDNLTKEFIPILNEIFFEGIKVVPKHRWIIVPGNHDVEWEKESARFNNFIQFCQDNEFHQYQLNEPEAIYSDIVCKEINTGNTFGIIGLNSCLDILDENSRNESNISKSYFSSFSKTWENNFREMPKLMVCHHMLHTIKGDKFDHALNALRDNNVLLSLAGDIHKSDSIADEISKIRCIPAGTISAKKAEREFGIDAVSRQFNLINLNLQSGYVKWYTYILEGTWREIKNESFYLEHASFSK